MSVAPLETARYELPAVLLIASRNPSATASGVAAVLLLPTWNVKVAGLAPVMSTVNV